METTRLRETFKEIEYRYETPAKPPSPLPVGKTANDRLTRTTKPLL